MTVLTPSINLRLSQSGFTMIEIIIVSAILGLVAMAMVVSTPKYFQRQRDLQRKSDLKQYKVALEEYYADNVCYPAVADLQNCGSGDLTPYLRRVLCDPNGQPYAYQLSNGCQQYSIYTNLEDTTDSDIEEVGCESGCGPGGAYNYGIVGGGALIN